MVFLLSSGLVIGLFFFGSAIKAPPFLLSQESTGVPKPPSLCFAKRSSGGHPRVLARATDMGKLKRRYHSAKMTAVKKALLSQAKAASRGHLPNGKSNSTIRRAYEAKAFLYLINNDEKTGQGSQPPSFAAGVPHQAVRMVLDYFKSLTAKYKKYGLFVAKQMNRSILGDAMVWVPILRFIAKWGPFMIGAILCSQQKTGGN